jgi:hypothetical protein
MAAGISDDNQSAAQGRSAERTRRFFAEADRPGLVSGFVTSRKVSICHIVRIVMADNPLQMKVDR